MVHRSWRALARLLLAATIAVGVMVWPAGAAARVVALRPNLGVDASSAV